MHPQSSILLAQDVKMVAWHPKGEVLVSCSYDDSIKVWVDCDGEWECAQTLAGPGLGHSSTVWGLAFDMEGKRMVSCSDDQTLRVWACSFDNPGDNFGPCSCGIRATPVLHVVMTLCKSCTDAVTRVVCRQRTCKHKQRIQPQCCH